MTTTTKFPSPVRGALACVALFGASHAMAQSVTGQLTDYVSDTGYAAVIENLSFSQGGSAYGGSGVVICIDAFYDFPPVPSTRTYDVVGAASVIGAAPTYANRAEALIDWVIDRYYTSFVANTIDGYAFNQVLWEITADFDGTRASLNSTAGDIYTAAPNDYSTMMSSLLASYSSISDAYRSTRYSTTFLIDRNSSYQDMVLVTPAVPEPSTYLTMFAGMGALMVWRRRNAQR